MFSRIIFVLFSLVCFKNTLAQILPDLVLPEGHSYTESGFTPLYENIYFDISNDEKYAVTANWSGDFFLWDISTHNLIRRVNAHESLCYIKISPDNQTIATSGLKDNYIKLWSLHSGGLIHSFKLPWAAIDFNFSLDANHLIANCKNAHKLFLFDLQNYEIVDTFNLSSNFYTNDAQFSFDKKLYFFEGVTIDSNYNKLSSVSVIERLTKKEFNITLDSANLLDALLTKDNNYLVILQEHKLHTSNEAPEIIPESTPIISDEYIEISIWDIKTGKKLSSIQDRYFDKYINLTKDGNLITRTIDSSSGISINANEIRDIKTLRVIRRESSFKRPPGKKSLNQVDRLTSTYINIPDQLGFWKIIQNDTFYDNDIILKDSNWWKSFSFDFFNVSSKIKSGLLNTVYNSNQNILSQNYKNHRLDFNLNTGKYLGKHKISGEFQDLCDSMNLLVYSDYQNIYLYNFNGYLLDTIVTQQNNIERVVIDPIRKQIISASNYKIHFWDLNNYRKYDSLILDFLGNREKIRDIDIDGNLLLITTDLKLTCFDLNQMKVKDSLNIILGYRSKFNHKANKIIHSNLAGKIKVIDADNFSQNVNADQIETFNLKSFFIVDDILISPNDSNFIIHNRTVPYLYDLNTGKINYGLTGINYSSSCIKNNGHSDRIISIWYVKEGKKIVTTSIDGKTIIWNAHTGKQLYTRLQLKGGDWLAYDEHYRFDGSPGGIDQLYLVCGLEVIDLNQVKDSLYVPGLVSQIMAGNKEIMLHDKPVAKLEDLQICELTPVVEPIDQDKTNRIRYRIIPRKGGLGNVELYINNNLTYTYKPSDLKKETNTKNYILEVNTDTLQQYLIGDKGTKNPITIKPLIKGGGIYGRTGGEFTAVKTVDRRSPKFIGVFVGVNDYNNPAKDKNNPSYYTDLSYAEADAESMAQAMEQSARTLFEDSVLIYRVTQQSNKAPTKQELEKVFDDISKKAKSEDVLYIFFAGHGGVPKTQANPNNELRFMLHQSNKQNPMSGSFGLSDIRQWTNAQRMKAQKRVFVFDACHSGKIIQEVQNNMVGNLYASRGTQDQGWRKKQLDKLKDQTGIVMLAASAADQVSYEDPQLKHGVMTYHLLEQMKQMPQDTTLIIKDWFESSSQGVESFIDRKYTRSTDDPYKPVQSPEMFGSGKFAVGVVNNQVKESIELAKVKLTIGKIDFKFRIKPGREKETVHQWIYEYLQQNIDPKKMEIAVDETAAYVYTIKGSISWGDEYVSYDIIKQGKVIKKEIELEGFNSKNPQQIAEAIAESIVKEINNIE